MDLKGRLELIAMKWMIIKGSYAHKHDTCMVKFSGHPQFFGGQISQNIDGYREKIHNAFRIHKTL